MTANLAEGLLTDHFVSFYPMIKLLYADGRMYNVIYLFFLKMDFQLAHREYYFIGRQQTLPSCLYA